MKLQPKLMLAMALAACMPAVAAETATITSSVNGDYILPFLPPGDYALTFEMTGFAAVRHPARVVIGQTVSWLTRVGAINYLGTVMVVLSCWEP